MLLVDDNTDTLEILRQNLGGASNGRARGLERARCDALLETVRPHVLVSDIAMPGEDGYDFIDYVRRRSPDRGGAMPRLRSLRMRVRRSSACACSGVSAACCEAD